MLTGFQVKAAGGDLLKAVAADLDPPFSAEEPVTQFLGVLSIYLHIYLSI